MFSLLLLALLTACSGMPGTREAPEEAVMAEALFAEGDFAAAARAFLDAAERSRSGRDLYRLRAGEAWRENASMNEAQAAIAEVDERRLDELGRVRLALLRAELALASKDDASARRWLAGLAGKRQAAPYRARLLELTGRAQQRQDPFAAARSFVELGELLEGRERSDNLKRIRGLLGGLRDSALRSAAAGISASDPMRPFVVRAMTARGFSVPPHLLRAPSSTGPVDLQPAPAATRRIALLLPLSGPLQAVGSSVRDGFLTARFQDGSGGAVVEVMDSGSEPAQSVAAYRRAVAAGADTVVGPLTREAVDALFAEADLPVPILALNRGSVLTPGGHASFALTPEDEGNAVAQRLQQRGLVRAIAVVSNEEAAQRALAGFRDRHESSGGSLLTTIVVDERAVDFQTTLRSALQSAGLPTALPTDLSVAHDPGFDAVFIAVRPAPARLLVPQLKLFGLAEVPMLATSLIHSTTDDARLDRELSNVEFCEAPWLVGDVPGLPTRSALATQLDSARGPAARLFAFGMDAWRLLQLRAQGDSELAVPGATGMLSIDDSGEAQREPGMAVFRGGRPQPVVEGALIPEAPLADGPPQG